MKVVSAEIMQKLDRRAIEECGIPGIVLMENAGRGTTDFIEENYHEIFNKKVAIFTGKGNNGGDGFVIARHLVNKGVEVKVFLLCPGDSLRGDALANFDIARRVGIEIVELQETGFRDFIECELKGCGLIVDAIFGTGLNSEVRGIFREVIDIVNQADAPTVSVDIPSGLSADSGKVLGISIRADSTVTFAYPKLGLLIYPGSDSVGKLETIDISIPKYLIDQENIHDHLIDEPEVKSFLLPRDVNSHKGDFGHLLVVAGALGKTGAASLTCEGAMRTGAGLVTLAIPESLNPIMECKLTEVMTEPVSEGKPGFLGIEAFEKIMEVADNKSALALGPGISTEDETIDLVHKIVQEVDIPLIIDADGLNAIANDVDILKRATAPIVLTPHPGEMARLMKTSTREVQNDRIGTARKFAAKWNVCLVLKGHKSIVSDPAGNIDINPSGNPGMAAGGMGDVLTGMLAGLLAQGLDMVDAAQLAVFVHGLAADRITCERGERGLLATEVLAMVPGILNELV